MPQKAERHLPGPQQEGPKATWWNSVPVAFRKGLGVGCYGGGYAGSNVPPENVQDGQSSCRDGRGQKWEKCAFLSDTYHFIPLGFESLGSWGSDALLLISQIGKKITDRTGELRATDFLRQRISIDIQGGSAISILGTLPDSRELSEIFYLVSWFFVVDCHSLSLKIELS